MATSDSFYRGIPDPRDLSLIVNQVRAQQGAKTIAFDRDFHLRHCFGWLVSTTRFDARWTMGECEWETLEISDFPPRSAIHTWASEAEALAGHAAIVSEIRATLPDVPNEGPSDE